jgi:hypothetical protein
VLSTPWRKISGFGKKSDLCNTLMRALILDISVPITR